MTLARVDAINADIRKCETELRFLGVDMHGLGISAGFSSYFGGESNVTWVSLIPHVSYAAATHTVQLKRIVERVSGETHDATETGAEWYIEISFRSSSGVISPVSITFKNGVQWPIFSSMHGLNRGDPDWDTFFKYHNDRPQKTSASVREISSDYLELSLSSVGPYVWYSGDDLTDVAYVLLTFRPR
jgi:hypothetical protein